MKRRKRNNREQSTFDDRKLSMRREVVNSFKELIRQNQNHKCRENELSKMSLQRR